MPTDLALRFEGPHRRFNALTGEWVLVSPQRSERPWLGQVESQPIPPTAGYTASCYLCPGNLRANGSRNPPYPSAFAFTNDFPALLPQALLPPAEDPAPSLLLAQPEAGTCRVVCYSPRHDLALGQLSSEQLLAVIDLWAREVAELGQRWRWVQVFENKGELMGCSNPHPHGQIWASASLPNEAAKEQSRQQLWSATHGTSLLLDYAAIECHEATRLIVKNEHWIAVMPWWAVWPFETLVIPHRRQIAHLPELEPDERRSLASLLSALLSAYDRLFGVAFPYSMGWHGAPLGDQSTAVSTSWQLHAHFYPPLLRSATVKKFMVGYEMLAEPQRDLTPEQAAERLRAALI